MKCSKCGAEIPAGSSTCPKCGTGGGKGILGKVLGILIIAGAAVLLLGYLVFARPFLATKPLADAVPGDSTAFVSVDLYNAGRTGLRYVNAIGRKRLMKMLETEEEEEKKEEKGPNLFGLIRPWVTREVLVVAGNISEDSQPEIGVFIGSHNAAAAEKNLPGIIDAIKEMRAGSVEEKDPKTADAIRKMKIKFAKQTHNKINVYCYQAEGMPAPKSDEPVGCWASTNRALVIASSRVYTERLIDSINGEKNAQQKYFAEMREKNVSDNYIYYAFVNGAQLGKVVSTQEKFKEKNGEMALKELSAMKGLLVSLAYNKLSPNLAATIFVDEGKVKSTQYLKQAVAFKSGEHKIDKEIYQKESIAYMTLNNVGTMLRSGVESAKADPEMQKTLEDSETGMDVKFDDFFGAIGEEFAVSLIDLKLDPKADFPYIPALIGALEVKDSEVFVRSVKRIVNANNKNVEDPAEQINIKSEGKDIYIFDIPNITKMSKDFKPCLGVGKGYVYFSLDPKILKEYMAGGKGKSSGVKSNLAVIVNPSKARGFMEQSYESKLKQMGKEQAAQAKKLQGFVLGMLDVFGPASLSLAIDPDKVSLAFDQTVNKRGLRKLPIEDAFAIMKEQQKQKEQEAAFTTCMSALDELSQAMEGYSAENDMGYYAGVDKNGDKLAPYIPDFSSICSPGDCIGEVKKRVEKKCEKGSFKVALSNENGFVLEAKPIGNPKLKMCVGPYNMKNYTKFSDFLKDPNKSCDFGF